ncbi:hypothetical protein PVAP13_9NG659566 [Panicum virgatum]|uniref:Uncharacterized protein n=1 Tax=Panicum virgatum TaxID=38727 RepID=A0A8T0MZ21_PANVG|nr:hypothetical protein PVAP13_9NG659566 [Panicum virgatum]
MPPPASPQRTSPSFRKPACRRAFTSRRPPPPEATAAGSPSWCSSTAAGSASAPRSTPRCTATPTGSRWAAMATRARPPWLGTRAGSPAPPRKMRRGTRRGGAGHAGGPLSPELAAAGQIRELEGGTARRPLLLRRSDQGGGARRGEQGGGATAARAAAGWPGGVDGSSSPLSLAGRQR